MEDILLRGDTSLPSLEITLSAHVIMTYLYQLIKRGALTNEEQREFDIMHLRARMNAIDEVEGDGSGVPEAAIPRVQEEGDLDREDSDSESQSEESEESEESENDGAFATHYCGDLCSFKSAEE